jgi:molybdopterin molybdotransferase
MDGYALQAADTAAPPTTLRVVGEVAAGAMPQVVVERGTAVRIMTGAPLPDGADAVVPVEDTDEAWRDKARGLPTSVEIRRTVLAGDFVRPVGGDIASGTAVLQPGHRLRPAEISLLASLGQTEVDVVRRPRVGVLSTGDELLEVHEALQPGKIRNSNGYAQAAQVAEAGGIPISLGIGRDTEADVRGRLQAGLEAGVDLFISSAGVSVGVYDVVTAVLQSAGSVGFWRVRMRPGKPLAFGRYQGIPYFGLPGNPVSSMVSFERFGRPALLKMGGHSQLQRPLITVTLTEAIASDGRESYIRALVQRTGQGYTAAPTGDQGSHMLSSLVTANSLLIVPEGVRHAAVGDVLQALMLDWPEWVF